MSIYIYPPATPEQVNELERHAKVTLPDQYKHFLHQHAGLMPDIPSVGSKFFEDHHLMKILASIGAGETMLLYGFHPLQAAIDGERTLFKENGLSSTAGHFREVLSHPFVFANMEYGDLAFNADGVDQSVYYVEVVHDHYDLETAQQWTYHATQEEFGGVVIPTVVAQRVADSFDEFYQMWLATLRDDIRFYPVLSQQERDRLLPTVKDLHPRTQVLDTVRVLYSLNDAYGYINNPAIQSQITSLLEEPHREELAIVDEAFERQREHQIFVLNRLMRYFDYALELKYILGADFAELRDDVLHLINLRMTSRRKFAGKYYLAASLLNDTAWRYYQYLAMLVLFGFNDAIKEDLAFSLQRGYRRYLGHVLKPLLERLAGVHLEVNPMPEYDDRVENNLKKIVDNPQRPKADIDRLMIDYLDHFKNQYIVNQDTYCIDFIRNFFAYDATLVAVVFDLDDSAFRDHVVYPKDLVDYYRQHHQQ